MAENIETPTPTGESQAAQTGAGASATSKISSMLNGLQNFNIADFAKGKPGQWKNAAIMAVVVILIMGTGAIMMWGLALWALSNSFADPRGGNSYVSGACFLNDNAFRDTDTITSSSLDDVMQKLDKWNPDRGDIEVIIRESITAGVNPAVLISFFGGEQSFKHENAYKAFGCDCPPGAPCPRSPENRGIDGQSRCALKVIKDAMAPNGGTGNYVEPKGQNTWTRLLYNYVAGERKRLYDNRGYVSDANEPRIVILKAIVPEDVVCVSNTMVAGSNHMWETAAEAVTAIGGFPRNGKNIVAYKFMGRNISGGVNKYIVGALDKVQEELKAKGVTYNFRDVQGYNWRHNVNNTRYISPHALGLAIDINPFNPNDNCNPRPSSCAARDPSPSCCRHNIPQEVSDTFEKYGFFWGAKFSKISDPMHFQYGGNYGTSSILWNGGNPMIVGN